MAIVRIIKYRNNHLPQQVHASDKATRYIDLLNNARLTGSWAEVPELVRKVNKHAPQRQCV